MTIKQFISKNAYDPQRTQATGLYELTQAERLERDTRLNIPRSMRAWSAEQTRPGSWNTGLGVYRPSGQGAAKPNGTGNPSFLFDPSEEGAQRK